MSWLEKSDTIGASPILSVGERFVDPSGVLDEAIRTGKTKHNLSPEEDINKQ